MTAKTKNKLTTLLSLLAGLGIGLFVKNRRSIKIAKALEVAAEATTELVLPEDPEPEPKPVEPAGPAPVE